VAAQQQQASLTQAQERLHGARPQAQLRAASRQQELAVAPVGQADAPAAWQRLGSAQEKFLLAQQVGRPPASE
jgi:hypothetical protein